MAAVSGTAHSRATAPCGNIVSSLSLSSTCTRASRGQHKGKRWPTVHGQPSIRECQPLPLTTSFWRGVLHRVGAGDCLVPESPWPALVDQRCLGHSGHRYHCAGRLCYGNLATIAMAMLQWPRLCLKPTHTILRPLHTTIQITGGVHSPRARTNPSSAARGRVMRTC